MARSRRRGWFFFSRQTEGPSVQFDFSNQPRAAVGPRYSSTALFLYRQVVLYSVCLAVGLLRLGYFSQVQVGCDSLREGLPSRQDYVSARLGLPGVCLVNP